MQCHLKEKDKTLAFSNILTHLANNMNKTELPSWIKVDTQRCPRVWKMNKIEIVTRPRYKLTASYQTTPMARRKAES